jgi:hypothetical protein
LPGWKPGFERAWEFGSRRCKFASQQGKFGSQVGRQFGSQVLRQCGGLRAGKADWNAGFERTWEHAGPRGSEVGLDAREEARQVAMTEIYICSKRRF